MLTTIKGTYENGMIFLEEHPSTANKTNVIVTFLDKQEPEQKKIKFGALKGKIELPEDFNEPIEDLNEYMF